MAKAKKKNKVEKIEQAAKVEKPTKKIKLVQKTKNISQHVEEIKRLNRICGQIEGISKMLDNNRKLQDVLTQFKAAHSALTAIEHRIFDLYIAKSVDDIIEAEKRKERDAKIEELKQLYRIS